MTATNTTAPDSGERPSVVTLDPTVVPKLAPEFIKYFNEVISKTPPTHYVPIEEVRNNPQKWTAPWIDDGEEVRKRSVDHQVPTTDGSTITARAYYPDPEKFGEGPYPVHVNYHGGGFVFGSLSADAKFCSTLRNELPMVVVDVDYRLCPEVAYGQNVRDCWSALTWVHENAAMLKVKPDSISVGGISAGGLFAIVVQHLARDAGLGLRLAIPAVPVTDDHAGFSKASDIPWPSFVEYENGPMLNWARFCYFNKYAFPDDKLAEIRASVPDWWIAPILAPNFSGLSDTFLITAECDPIRDEGEAYAAKAITAGNLVTVKRYLGVPHPFMHMTEDLPQAVQYEKDVFNALRTAHGLW
ncbi:alpha/beta-hydrolase [Thozetella sp. PMI_491]|nr:alpha/beta-hydrolase [Thozetella sp. PMI_491]